MTKSLLTHLLVPIANEKDATATCRGLESYVGAETETITVVHVIEKAGGYMDKAPLEAREQQAERVFEIVEGHFADGPQVRRELRYGTDVIDEIVAAANEFDVSAIGFTPRSESRVRELLAGDPAYRLITESRHPVIVFSDATEQES
ncbi:universal stress protein [Halopiger aswanensis]|uniref:Universal stress protein family protein n=1 Tax=Halopiger aswanensis TaxID=148449 RepID=A0A3R7HW44_9EURY|nr:universal stress protein [Halopiger aswanensis]RKD93256.1 universal stress protein family protein [Halopiger aswanensis]